MLELYIENSKTKKIYNLSELVQDIKWDTNYKGKASCLIFNLVNDDISIITNGSKVTFKYNKANIFYGYIFNISFSNKKTISVTAYDQIRYLMMKDTYIFKAKRADEVIKRIVSDYQLKSGLIANTQYQLPSMIHDSKTLLDIIYESLETTKKNTGKEYLFYDDFGKLVLKDTEDMQLPIIIGQNSLMTSFNYQKSINNDTYNRVKLTKDTVTDGIRVTHVEKDENNIASWGILQYYEKVSQNQNKAQIIEKAKEILKDKNREGINLSLEAIGDLRIRAGNTIYTNILNYDTKQPLMVESCIHQFTSSQHTMSLTLKVI